MYLFFKRVIDIILASLALFFLMPFFFVVILILLFTGEGEVFYLQERLGYLNKKFKIIKFATMIKDSPKIGTGSITLRNDPRVLPFGKFLRKSKINELPQIINVILGSMSLVGPRPQMEVDFIKFPSKLRNLIYKSKPGITGIGSVVFRDEEKWISNFDGDKHNFYRNKIAPYKAELEIWYLKKSSIKTDFLLILITAWIILFPNSDIIEKVFKDLPKKPSYLK